MDVLVALGAVVGIALLLYLFRGDRKKRILSDVPGPKPLPLVGNALAFAGIPHEDVFRRLCQFMSEHNPVCLVWFGSLPYALLTSPTDVEVVLGNAKHVDRPVDYEYMQPWLGTGLLTSTGSKWHLHRKLITPAFHFRILENFVPVFNATSQILVQKLKEKLGASPFNVFPYITLCTLDIICESVMGISVNAQRNENSDYVKAVYKLSEIIHDHQFSLLQLPNWLFSLTPSGWEQTKMLNIVHGFTNKVIQERKALFKELKSQRQDTEEEAEEESIYLSKKKRLAFLDLLLESSDGGNLLSDEEIREEVDTFMFEGHDTTSAGVCWSLFLLGLHLHVQERVAKELEAIFGTTNRPATLQDLNDMKYLERCIKESLRLYPSVPEFARLLKEDVKITNHTLPAGTTAVVVPYVMHRDAKTFPNPENFNPDNFLPERIQGRHPYAYIPFSAGPRNCIGQKFAMLEMKAVISSVLRNFKVQSADTRESVTVLAELILRPKEGIRVTVESRNVS